MKNSVKIIFMSLIFMLSSCMYGNKKVKRLNNEAMQHGPYDAIIVPGYPHHSVTKWDKITKARVYWAKYLYENNFAKNIIFSGSAVYTPYTEALIMKEYALEMGIPDTVIYTECDAEHSVENIFYSYFLAQQHGFSKLALATDPFQSKMVASFMRRKMKRNVNSMPIDFSILENLGEIDYQINDSALFVKDFLSITEREGFFKRLRGTLGKNIDYKAWPKIEKKEKTKN